MEKTPWQYPPLSQGPVGAEHIALLPTGQATPAGDADCGCPVVATGHPTSAGQVGNDPEQFSAGSQADLLGRQTVPAGSSLLVGHFADSPLQNPPASHSPSGFRHCLLLPIPHSKMLPITRPKVSASRITIVSTRQTLFISQKYMFLSLSRFTSTTSTTKNRQLSGKKRNFFLSMGSRTITQAFLIESSRASSSLSRRNICLELMMCTLPEWACT